MSDIVTGRGDSKLLLLSNDAMRARRRPRAILWLWGFKAALSLSVAWPAARAIGTAYGAHPSGDAALFADGGYAMLEWLSRETATRGALTALFAAVTAVGIAFGVLPLVAAIAAIAHATPEGRAPRARQLVAIVAECAWPALGLLGLATLAEAACGALAYGISEWSHDWLTGHFGEVRGEQTLVAIFAIIACLAAIVGVVHDLARAALVRFRKGVAQALAVGVTAFRARPAALVWAWAWRSLAGLSLIALGAIASTRLGGRPGSTLVALACLHQLVALATVAMRASWLARALRAADASGSTL